MPYIYKYIWIASINHMASWCLLKRKNDNRSNALLIIPIPTCTRIYSFHSQYKPNLSSHPACCYLLALPLDIWARLRRINFPQKRQLHEAMIIPFIVSVLLFICSSDHQTTYLLTATYTPPGILWYRLVNIGIDFWVVVSRHENFI